LVAFIDLVELDDIGIVKRDVDLDLVEQYGRIFESYFGYLLYSPPWPICALNSALVDGSKCSFAEFLAIRWRATLEMT
jgi:hypothetical protein